MSNELLRTRDDVTKKYSDLLGCNLRLSQVSPRDADLLNCKTFNQWWKVLLLMATSLSRYLKAINTSFDHRQIMLLQIINDDPCWNKSFVTDWPMQCNANGKLEVVFFCSFEVLDVRLWDIWDVSKPQRGKSLSTVGRSLLTNLFWWLLMLVLHKNCLFGILSLNWILNSSQFRASNRGH